MQLAAVMNKQAIFKVHNIWTFNGPHIIKNYNQKLDQNTDSQNSSETIDNLTRLVGKNTEWYQRV